jgi:hypothetical protein
MIFVQPSMIGSTVSAFSGGNIGTTRDAHLGEALHPVKILANAEQTDFEGSRIASGLPHHLAEFRQGLCDIAAPGSVEAIDYLSRDTQYDVNSVLVWLNHLGRG